MEIPKKIQKLLDKRENLAEKLIIVSADLDTWLEKNGADFNDPDLMDSTSSGCRIYYEPTGAKVDVEAYIKNKM